MLDGLKSAIEARESKIQKYIATGGTSQVRNMISRIDNARSHHEHSLEEIKLGFIAIEQFDKLYNEIMED